MVKLFGIHDCVVGVFIYYCDHKHNAFQSDWLTYLPHLQRNDNISIYHFTKVRREKKKIRRRGKKTIKKFIKK